MNFQQYILEPYSGSKSRHVCPQCGKGKEFTFYIDKENKKPLGVNVGRCNRTDSCGYHKTPKQFFEENGTISTFERSLQKSWELKTSRRDKPVAFINTDIFKGSLKNFDKNKLIIFLENKFGAKSTKNLIEKYFIGTSNKFDGGTVFWQIDIKGKIRAGKIMGYDPSTGKRVKEPINQITWVHTALKLDPSKLNQCLFGGHLLKDVTKPVGVVESEKTALIASLYLPDFIWVACGGKEGLTEIKVKILRGRNVILYPDLNGYVKWKLIANKNGFKISDLLETKATEQERDLGLDLADYLLGFDNRDFFNENSMNVSLIKPQSTFAVCKDVYRGLQTCKRSDTDSSKIPTASESIEQIRQNRIKLQIPERLWGVGNLNNCAI
jgi:Domain of unknown function (DUF6371)